MESNSVVLIKNFRDYLTMNGKSENTMDAYCRNLKLYIQWEEDQTGQPFDGYVTETSAECYLKYLEDKTDAKGKHLSLSTIKAKITAVQIFVDYMAENNGYPKITVPQKKGSIDPEVEILNRNEINKLKRWLDRDATILQNAVVRLLLNTGIRVSELCALELSDIQVTEARQKGILIIRSGKGGKYRKVPLNEKAINALDKYLAIRPNTGDPHVFIGQRGALGRIGIYDMVSKVGEKALNKKLYPHMLRHIRFTTMAKDEKHPVDIKTIASLAGHGNINTTAKYYVNSSWEEKESAVSSTSF